MLNLGIRSFGYKIWLKQTFGSLLYTILCEQRLHCWFCKRHLFKLRDWRSLIKKERKSEKLFPFLIPNWDILIEINSKTSKEGFSTSLCSIDYWLTNFNCLLTKSQSIRQSFYGVIHQPRWSHSLSATLGTKSKKRSTFNQAHSRSHLAFCMVENQRSIVTGF